MAEAFGTYPAVVDHTPARAFQGTGATELAGVFAGFGPVKAALLAIGRRP